MIVFMLFDGGVKILNCPPPWREPFDWDIPPAQFSLSKSLRWFVSCFYGIPRTSILGAILLTGYLGGATFTQVRVQDAWYIFPRSRRADLGGTLLAR